MQLVHLNLKATLVLATVLPAVGKLLPAIAQEEAKTSVGKPAQVVINPVFGKIVAIDNATQTIKIVDRQVKIVKVKAGDKMVNAVEREPEIVRFAKMSPQTQFSREERTLTAKEIKLGDSISYLGVKGHSVTFNAISIAPIAASTEPLTFNIKGIKPNNLLGGSDAVVVIQRDGAFSITVVKPEAVKFARFTAIKNSDLAVGQSVLVYPSVQPDTKSNAAIEAFLVTVIAEKS